ncbi:MAG: transcription elongation factor GreA, partial [Candidatus Moraniibacteriota bacterium]
MNKDMPKILTKDGYKKIEDELEMRKIAMRQEIASAIKEAK